MTGRIPVADADNFALATDGKGDELIGRRNAPPMCVGGEDGDRQGEFSIGSNVPCLGGRVNFQTEGNRRTRRINAHGRGYRVAPITDSFQIAGTEFHRPLRHVDPIDLLAPQ